MIVIKLDHLPRDILSNQRRLFFQTLEELEILSRELATAANQLRQDRDAIQESTQ